MINAEEIVNEAIASFDNVEAALEAKNVDVPEGTDTINYGSLVSSLDGTGVSQTYDPESEFPLSGKAVAEAIAPVETKVDKNSIAIKEVETDIAKTANALKATASGETVTVNDVSPLEHTAKAKVTGKNLVYSNVNRTVEIAGLSITKTKGSAEFVIDGKATADTSCFITENVQLEAGTYTCSVHGLNVLNAGVDRAYVWDVKTDKSVVNGIMENVPKTFTIDEPKTVRVDFVFGIGSIYENKAIQLQLEKGDTATEYEPYIDPTTVTVTRYGADESDNAQTFTPEADGTVLIPSLSPTMTLLTDTPGANIELEYNQDINVAMGNVKEDITELDRVTSENIAQTDANTRAIEKLEGNILKGTTVGVEYVVLNDVSPIPHDITVTEDVGSVFLYRMGKNFFNYKAWVEYCNGNGGNGATETVMYLGEECFSYKVLPRDGSLRFLMDGIQENTQYTLTMEYAISSFQGNESYAMGVLYIYYTDGTYDSIFPTAYTTKFIKYTHTTKAGKTVLGFRIPGFDKNATVYVKKNMQFEIGTASTEFMPYVEPVEYYSDGNPIKIPSLYPTTVVTGMEAEGLVITAEYNRDINKVIANLENAILSLGGNV